MKQIDIFYADDDEDDLGFFNEVTDQISEDIDVLIKLHTHINGENLIENIKKNKGENTIVFLDINMPFKSGFEFLEEIRKEPGINSIPIVMYSTSSNQDNVERSFALGASFYVVKPYQYSTLLKMITTVIQTDWENHKPDHSNFLYK